MDIRGGLFSLFKIQNPKSKIDKPSFIAVIDKFSRHIASIGSAIKARVAESGLNRSQPFVGSVFIASVLVTSAIAGVRQIGGFQHFELIAFDRMLRTRSLETTLDERLTIVAITEADIQEQQQWPISDGIIAEVLEKLSQYEPAAIGLDLYRDVPQEPGHWELREQLESIPNIIGITKLPDAKERGVPAPPILPPESIGFNDIVNDPDGVVRRNLMFASTQDSSEVLFSFALRVALRYLADRNIKPRNNPSQPNRIGLGKAEFTPLTPNSGGYETIDANGYQILLNYRSPGSVGREISLGQVLKGEFDPNWIEDKIVLIGTTAPSEKDMFFTPYGVKTDTENFKMPGVSVHAQMLSQILNSVLDGQPLFWFWPEWAEVLWIAIWSVSGGLLALRIRHPAILGAAVTVGLSGLMGTGFVLFLNFGWVPVVSPAVAFTLTGGCVIASKLLYHAFHDDLTGLPNRALFMKELRRANRRVQVKNTQNAIADLWKKLRGHKPEVSPFPTDSLSTSKLAVLFLDLDRFKIVNDGLGHDVGDRLLIAFAERIRKTLAGRHGSSLASTTTLARVGGDEFAILLENLRELNDASSIADYLSREVTLPFNLNGKEVFTTASIGMAINVVGEKRDLLRDAHTAMYRAKALGKSRPEVFETTMHKNAVARFQLETDLRRAIAENEELIRKNGTSFLNSQFVLYYQPLICLKTLRIAGFEALIRWQHPQRGMISPGEFIPVAEETGLIVPIGEWVLRVACWQIKQWHQKFPHQPPLIMSVNLSGKQFSQPNMIEVIEQTLRETSIEPSSLKLEITESVVMDEVELAIDMLSQMKALNLKLGIDDFGTGYSSLSYLHRFPTDTLKVDRSFVSRMGEGEENAAIVKTIIALAHNLKMDVIAEGVETPAQLTKLRSFGCEYAQGFFFAKPLPTEVAEELLTSDPQW